MRQWDISSVNSILQNAIIVKYYFSDAWQSRTPSSFHWYYSRYNRRWSLAVVALSYAQLILTSEQNQNCSDPQAHLIQALIYETRPSRPIRCDVWIVERMRYRPTNRQTDRQTDRPTDTASYRGALSHLKRKINLHQKIYQMSAIWFL